jgi:phosphatidylserine/phosphatidylglycerophosphate/cardiolipin synthase-like enzyme
VPLFGADRPPKQVPLDVQVSALFKQNLLAAAARHGMSVDEFLQAVVAPEFADKIPEKKIVSPVTATVVGHDNGKPVQTSVTTLMGPVQIFQAWHKVIDSAQNYLQVALYDFDNMAVGGRGQDGAAATEAWALQQQILPKIIEKARQGVKVQVIVDNSVEYEYNQFNEPIHPRKHNNQPMRDYLERLRKEEGLPIEVVPYPQALANIYHIKFVNADGKKAVVAGMNSSNHSAANWDMGVLLEGPEVANIQHETFDQDLVASKFYRLSPGQRTRQKLAQIKAELPQIDPVSDPAIQVLNTMPREYEQLGFEPREEMGEFFKREINNPALAGVYSEQFIQTHPEYTQDAIRRAVQDNIPIRILHASGVLKQFPYTRKTIYAMNQYGKELVRFYNEDELRGQQMHAKLTVFLNKNPQKSKVVLGSGNASVAAWETNVDKGPRPDATAGKARSYRRGNRDFAIVIQSPEIAQAFIRQINIDWDFSEHPKPPAYGLHEAVQQARLPERKSLAQFLDREA